MKTNSEYRSMASEALKGNWTVGAVATLAYMLLSVAISQVLGENWGNVASLLLIPMAWGLSVMFLDVIRGQKAEYNTLVVGYQGGNFGRVFLTMLLQGIYTMLWTLLLIVPGIMKACSYGMTSFILRDHPELQGNAAIEKSMAMMEGHKMQYFLLQLSFIGWIILSCLTLGIGFFFLVPYMETAMAAFYEDVRKEAL